jgi:hypothetical protein
LDDFCECRLAYPAALDFFNEFLSLDGPGSDVLDDLTLADIFVWLVMNEEELDLTAPI